MRASTCANARTHTHTHAYTHAYTHTHRLSAIGTDPPTRIMYVCMYVCVYVCVCVQVRRTV